MKSISLSDTPRVKVSTLPCKIDYNGPVNKELLDPEREENSLFGRRVLTSTLPLPAGFGGFVIEGNTLKNSRTFTEFNYITEEPLLVKEEQLAQALEYMEMMSKMAAE